MTPQHSLVEAGGIASPRPRAGHVASPAPILLPFGRSEPLSLPSQSAEGQCWKSVGDGSSNAFSLGNSGLL